MKPRQFHMRVLRQPSGNWIVRAVRHRWDGTEISSVVTTCPTWRDAMFFACCHMIGPTKAALEFPS